MDALTAPAASSVPKSLLAAMVAGAALLGFALGQQQREIVVVRHTWVAADTDRLDHILHSGSTRR